MKPPRPCPVCESQGERRVLHQQRFYEGVLGDGYDVVICSECGAGFADGIPEQAELDRYYAEQSKYTYSANGGAESPYDIARFETIVDQVAAYLPSKEARILDVGCATGGLLSVFKRRGYHNVIGTDPSPACAEAARRLYDIEVRTSTVAQLHIWADQFDLVLVIGVLEHIREVHAALEALKSRLNLTGLLYIAVPDIEGFAECRNAPFQQFSMEHMNFFSLRSLDSLMVRNAFSAVSVSRWTVEWREGVTEPIASGFYRKGRGDAAEYDPVGEPALRCYIFKSDASDQAARQCIDILVTSREPLLIWGAGALTRRLLASTALGQANVVGIVDSNLRQQGRYLAGRRILSPEQILGSNEQILVCSVAFEREIVGLIRGRLALGNPVLTLYSRS